MCGVKDNNEITIIYRINFYFRGSLIDRGIYMKKNYLCMTIMLLTILLINTVFVSASDEFWIMEQRVDQPMGFGISTDSESNPVFTYTLYTVLPDNIIIKTKKLSHESGQCQWENTHNDESIPNLARDIAVDSLDNVVVIGTKGGDWLILKYDPSGTMLWQETYDSGDGDYVHGLAVDSSDNIIVTGKGGSLCLTRKYSPNGDYLDEMVYTDDVSCAPRDVVVDSEDNIIVAGQEGDDYFIVKYDANGELWRQKHDRGNIDRAYGVAVDSMDNIVVTGISEFTENTDQWYGYLTLKYEPSGTLLWTKAFDNMEYESYAYDVAVDQSDNIYVTGLSGDEAFTIRYDKDGISRWSRRFSAGPDTCVGHEVVVDGDGNLLVACYSGGTFDATYYIIKYLITEGGGQSSIDELGDEIEYMKDVMESMQELLQGILDWIDRLPMGLKRLYEG